MKLNDPFGRMEKRHQVGYETVRAAMRQSGIDTPEAAQEIISKTGKRAMKALIAGMAVLLLVLLLWPKAMFATLGLALLFFTWVGIWTINGRRYITRYIDEELT